MLQPLEGQKLNSVALYILRRKAYLAKDHCQSVKNTAVE